MLLYGKNFAITAQPGVAAPLANVPADYEKRLVKMDFKYAADNRERILAEWSKRYDAKSEPEEEMRRSSGADGGADYLRLEGIRKSFGSFEALKDIDLAVAQGEFVCFLGPSGCGKTTLLRIIAGLETQTAGRILQGERDISRAAAGRARLRHRLPVVRAVSRTSRSPTTSPTGSSTATVAKATAAARVDELLKLVGLPGSGAKFPAQLSGGQQQRIALARALATSPGLLLLDEPLSALDALERVRLRQEIRSLQRKLGVTTIMVTHDQEEALSVADRIVVMNQGVIEQVGTPMEIYRDPATPFVADFVGKINVLSGRLRPGPRPAHRREPVRVRARHRRRARGQGLPAARGRAGAADRAGRRQRLRRRDRQDRVPRLVLPRPRQRRGDRRAADHRLPVAQLPRRAGARGRQPAAAASCCPSGCASSERAAPTVSAVLPAPPRARAAPARALDRSRRPCGAARCVAAALVVFLALPLATILAKALQDKDGALRRPRQLRELPGTPALLQSFVNSVWVSPLVTVVTVPLAFGFAYALARSCIPCKGMFRTIALIPLLAPTLLSAISLIYWFGNQGVAKGLIDGARLREHLRRAGHRRRRVLRRLPARADDPGQRAVARRRAAVRGRRRARHVDAAQVLHDHAAGREVRPDLGGAGRFTLVMTDFGIPKVIGGNFNMLATDVFKLVIGQQDFQRGAVVGLLLLTPAVLTFGIDWLVQRKQTAMLTARAVPLRAEAVARLRRADARLRRRRSAR